MRNRFIFAIAIWVAPAVAQTYTLLWSFNGNDGAKPAAGVVLDPNGNLYGTTSRGGKSTPSTRFGTVFRLKPPASSGGAWTEKVLYAFTSSAEYPYGRIFRETGGDLFGTTRGGCCAAEGKGSVVFKIDTNDVESVVYTFSEAADGAYPYDGVTQSAPGDLYGTTGYGGNASGECASVSAFPGCGVMYELDTGGNETLLHSFAGGKDGANPGPVVRETDGNIFGTVWFGGLLTGPCAPNGCGYVYELDAAGRFKILLEFAGGVNGTNPFGRLARDGAGNLYGVAGGGLGYGIVYKLDLAGTLTVLYRFAGGSEGAAPSGGVILSSVDPGASLYGTTTGGGMTGGGCGDAGCGVVFKLDSAGAETVLHTFAGTDGQTPNPDLAMDPAGNLYGTTLAGGNSNCAAPGCGVVFMVSP